MSTRPLPFSLRQLQYVLAVADLKSFSRAAEACHVSQPALSMQVAQVEEAFGIPLFERDRRPVLPTPAGELFLPHVRRLIEQAHVLPEHARRLRDPLSSLLRVGVIPTVAPYLLPRLTPAFRLAHPNLMVLWHEERTDVIVARVRGQELDAALLAAEADLDGLETTPVGIDVFSLALPLTHALATSSDAVSLDTLRDEPMLLLEEGHCLRSQVLAACAWAGPREREFRATSLSTLVHVVASGAGVTLLPSLAVEVEGSRAPLAIRPLMAPAPHRTLVLGWRRGSPLRGAMLTFAETVRAAAGLPAGDDTAQRSV